MNATEAINKIAVLLGIKFKSEKFMVTKLVDGSTEITNNQEGPFSVGEGLFVVGEDSVLVPAPSGSHETREGLILTVGEDSIISKIEDKPMVEESSPVIDAATDVEIETEVLSKATLTDGTKIETDEESDFAVGQKLYVITESGERVSAPEGEHTTESGITLVVDGEGVITGVKYPDEEGEGSLGDMKSDMKNMKQAMTEMLSMLNNFSKDFESYKKDYEEFKNSPVHNNPVVRKTFGQENLMDAKVRFLREALKN
jgi:hypothetical protein